MLGQESEEVVKQDRFYLRFHNCISRAIELNQQIFGDRLGKDGKEPCFEHSLRVAGFSEEIFDQTMEHYHLTWLLGILHDNKEQNPLLFSEKIDFVLQDLFPYQRQLMKKYIDQLTSDKTLSKGNQKGEQLKKIEKMDLVPTWVLLFDKYDNCNRFKANGCGKSKKELDGYFSVAYIIYLKAKNRHKEVEQFIPTVIKDFYEKMGQDLGGQDKAISFAKDYCQSF